MNRKRIHRYFRVPSNKFPDGGPKPTWGQQFSQSISDAFKSENLGSTIPSLLGGVSGVVSGAIANSQIADTSGIESQLRSARNISTEATDLDNLMAEWGSWNKAKDNYTAKDLMQSGSSQAGNILGSAASGAAMGSIGGGLGAIIGGGVGLISGLFGRGAAKRKARRQARKLNRMAREANQRNLATFSMKADNIDTQNNLNMLAGYYAFGGPLGGAIDYELAQRELNNQQLNAMSKFKFTSLPASAEIPSLIEDINTFADGGDINIKKKNWGKFTQYCGGKVTSECIRRGKNSPSAAIRKRATFAQNARGWKHAFGGDLQTHGGDYSNGVTFIEEGGTHEQNPNGGVMLGVDQNSTPNLVEQGEVIYNDYVFSDRLKLPKDTQKKYKFKGNTFADAAKSLQKESAERPNDPLSINSLKVGMQRLADAQEELKMRKQGNTRPQQPMYEQNTFAIGGDKSKYRKYNNYTDIPPDWYTPSYMDFVESLSQYSPESTAWMQRINSGQFGPVGGNTFEDVQDIKRLAVDRKKGPVHNAMLAAMDSTPLQPNSPVIEGISNPLDLSLSLPQEEVEEEGPVGGMGNKRASWLRYAPVVGAGLATITDMFSRPDYSNADMVMNSVSGLREIAAPVIGDYLSYKPLDRNYYLNKLNRNASATRRAIQNTSGGNRAQALAGILAADYGYGESLGQLARQAEEYNQQQRERVGAFNRGTNQFNAETSLRAAMANKQNEELRFRGATTAAQMRDRARQQYDMRRSNNLNNLIQGLGDIGTENEQRNWLDFLAESGVLKADTRGRYTGNRKSGKSKSKKRRG